MTKRTALRCGLILILGTLATTTSADESVLTWEQRDGSLALIAPTGMVWRFQYAAELPKPFFDPVCLVGGESLTWNQPPDHPWHHAFWFSWHTINGVNYWEHNPATGRPVGRTSWDAPTIKTDASGAARIEMQLAYSPGDAPTVLKERRIVEVSSPDQKGGYFFDWDATFTAMAQEVTLDRTPIPPDPNGQPWGGYAGLSLRLAKSLEDRGAVTDRGAAEFDAGGVHRSVGIACEYQGKLNGMPVGIAVLSHPDNPRYPTPFYVIRSEMSYLNPAFLQDHAYKIPPGESLRLRYRIVVHAENWNADRLRSEADAFGVR